MKFIIVSGMSGAGKSSAMTVLEDIGFYCVDNMPTGFITRFAEICYGSQDKMPNVAIVTDIRSGTDFGGLLKSLDDIKKSMGIEYKILYLDASDDVITRRYSETRRKHPLSGVVSGSMKDRIAFERKALMPISDRADYYIDTSFLSSSALKDRIENIFNEGKKIIDINIMSFGFKFGIPDEADMVFDVRCLPNPFYIPELKNLTGVSKEVSGYVFSFESSKKYYKSIEKMMDMLLPLFIEEGKSRLTIAIGCTGGKHRSVSFAEKLYKKIKKTENSVGIIHRDIDK